MKQNMKKVLLVLCMAVCFFALSACGSKNDTASEPVPEEIAKTMESGAENYLKQFDSYDDAALADELKRMQKQKNTTMESAITSWQSSKADLGKMVSIISKKVERVSEDSYEVTVLASFEKRNLEFVLTAEEVIDSSYGGTALSPTELLFSPVFTTGEKLARAGMNTLMGMGTVFLVLIFISFIISGFKNINKFEANMKAKKAQEAAAKAAAETPVPAPVAAPAPAVPAPAMAAAAVPEEIPAPVKEPENLADDLELVAVITAAIAAASSVPVEGLVVRSIRRKSGSKWKNA